MVVGLMGHTMGVVGWFVAVGMGFDQAVTIVVGCFDWMDMNIFMT